MRATRKAALALAIASTVTASAEVAAGPAAAAPKPPSPAYTVTDLGSLGGTIESQPTEPSAINANGQVTGFSYTSTVVTETCGHYKPPRTCSFNPQHAFLWSDGTMTDLGSLGGPDQGSSGIAINRSGEVAGISGTKTAGVTHAALWTGAVTVDLGALAPLSSGSWSEATGINDSGQVVGVWAPSQSTSGTAGHPWLYSNGTMTSLPEPSNLTSPSCEPTAINNNGQIAGVCGDGSSTGSLVLWQNGTVTTLGTAGDLHVSWASAINNNGLIAGYGTTSTGATQGFLDSSNGTMTGLGSFFPFGLNDNGVMIGCSGSNCASIDSGGTVQDLNNLIPANSGYQLSGASAINNNGQVVATANDSTAAVLLTPN